MENKTNKELAVEATIEYTKSWNSASNTQPMKADQFIDLLKAVYSTLSDMDKD